MGLFVYTQKGSIISMVDLPTTEIIEPIYKERTIMFSLLMLVNIRIFLFYRHNLIGYLGFKYSI